MKLRLLVSAGTAIVLATWGAAAAGQVRDVELVVTCATATYQNATGTVRAVGGWIEQISAGPETAGGTGDVHVLLVPHHAAMTNQTLLRAAACDATVTVNPGRWQTTVAGGVMTNYPPLRWPVGPLDQLRLLITNALQAGKTYRAVVRIEEAR